MRRLIAILLLTFLYPLISHANDGSVRGYRTIPGIYKMTRLPDTIPVVTKKPEETTPVPAEVKPVSKIKEVPKSRRQVKPVAVPAIPVTPIKIIKPKIIRRTIGIIGLH